MVNSEARSFSPAYRLDGRWSFSSGCDHASWVLLGGIVTNDEGKPVDFRTFLLPASDYVIDDVWDTVGLRGTGSNDIVVDGAFVPEHRSLSFTDVTRCVCQGQQVNPGLLYRIPFGSIFSYAITTPIIGMATGAYAAHVEAQRGRVRASYVGQKAAEDPYGQVRIAEAAALLDAAWLALERDMTELMAHARTGEKIPLPLRLRVRRTGRARRQPDDFQLRLKRHDQPFNQALAWVSLAGSGHTRQRRHLPRRGGRRRSYPRHRPGTYHLRQA